MAPAFNRVHNVLTSKICPRCGIDFGIGSKYPSNLKRQKFCSKACSFANMKSVTDAERFWSKVDNSDKEGCWVWIGAKQRAGYGHFRNQAHKTVTASRFSYALANGPIPEGMHVLHRCDNRACVRPSHLFLGTHDENMADMRAKGRHTFGEKNRKNKITEEQARQILALRGQVKSSDLAKQYGLNYGSINAIWKGRAWRHIHEQ